MDINTALDPIRVHIREHIKTELTQSYLKKKAHLINDSGSGEKLLRTAAMLEQRLYERAGGLTAEYCDVSTVKERLRVMTMASQVPKTAASKPINSSMIIQPPSARPSPQPVISVSDTDRALILNAVNQCLLKILPKQMSGAERGQYASTKATQIEAELLRQARVVAEYKNVKTLERRVWSCLSSIYTTNVSTNPSSRNLPSTSRPESQLPRSPTTSTATATTAKLNSASEQFSPTYATTTRRSPTYATTKKHHNSSRQSSSDTLASAITTESIFLLKSLVHSYFCTLGDRCTNTTNCTYYKGIVQHVIDCKHTRFCMQPQCGVARKLMVHFKDCKSVGCVLCGPSRELMRTLTSSTAMAPDTSSSSTLARAPAASMQASSSSSSSTSATPAAMYAGDSVSTGASVHETGVAEPPQTVDRPPAAADTSSENLKSDEEKAKAKAEVYYFSI